MPLSFAAMIFRTAEVPDRALSQGFAIALGGWDVPSPRLSITPLPGLPGYSVAFYASGTRLARGAEDEETEHAQQLFEDELSPHVEVREVAEEHGHGEPTLYTLVFSEDPILDDAFRHDARGIERHFVREGESGVEAGYATEAEAEVEEVALDRADDASEEEEQAALLQALRPHRGSTFLSAELGAPVLPALMGALYADARRLEIRLSEPGPEAIETATRSLCRTLGRVPGRGAVEPPARVSGVAPPAAFTAFARAYDWQDPNDAQDLYRGLSIGAIEGTLRFLRDTEIAALDGDAGWAAAAADGLYPIARLLPSALGSAGALGAIVALGADGERLAVVRAGGRAEPAGPLFGELLTYLALGWSRRNMVQEDLIGALMLRARWRIGVR